MYLQGAAAKWSSLPSKVFYGSNLACTLTQNDTVTAHVRDHVTGRDHEQDENIKVITDEYVVCCDRWILDLGLWICITPYAFRYKVVFK